MSLTEDENGRIRAGDGEIMMGLTVEDFFIKLSIFKERMQSRIDQINKAKRNG